MLLAMRQDHAIGDLELEGRRGISDSVGLSAHPYQIFKDLIKARYVKWLKKWAYELGKTIQLVSQWVYVQCKWKICIYLSQLYSCAHVASQNERPLQASYKARICAQVNPLVRAKLSFAEYNCCKTSPHTFGSDAENPECTSSRRSND